MGESVLAQLPVPAPIHAPTTVPDLSVEADGRADSGKLGRLVLCALLTIAFTLVSLQYSYLHGKLVLHPVYDDVGYMTDGLNWLDQIYQEGPAAVVAKYLRHPTHAPGSTFLAVVSFSLFGRHDWSCYAGNGLVIFALLMFVDRMLMGMRLWQRVLVYLFVLSCRLCGTAIVEFRPDIPWGIALAAACVLTVDHPLLRSSLRHKLAIGALFGLALLIKPTTFPLTLALLGLSLLVATVSDWRLAGRRPKISELSRAWLIPFAVAAILAGWYYLASYKTLWGYIYSVMYGQYRDVYRVPGSLWFHLRYFITGRGGEFIFGRTLYTVAAAAAVGALTVLLTDSRERKYRLASLAAVIFVAYLEPALNRTKNEFFGASFQVLLLLGAVMALALLAERASRSRRRLSWEGILFLVLSLTGIAAFQFPRWNGDRSSPGNVEYRRMVEWAYSQLRDASDSNPATVFVTDEGFACNAMTLQYFAKLNSVPLFFTTASGFDFSEYPRAFALVDYVVACEPGNFDLKNMEKVPANQWQDKTLELIRSDKHFKQFASYRTLTGKSFFLFARRQPFGGWESASGLTHKDGPYPQFNVPAYRVGLAPTTTLRFISKGGAIELLATGLTSCPGQQIDFKLDGKPCGRYVFHETGSLEDIDLSFSAPAGPHELDLRYSKHQDHARQLQAVAFRQLLLLQPPAENDKSAE